MISLTRTTPAKASLVDRALTRMGLSRARAAAEAVRAARRRGLQAGMSRGVQHASRVFAAAQVTRLTGDWSASILSPDQEQKGALRRLRGASRALERDNAYGARFFALLTENVIGHDGIQLQVRKESTRKRPDKTLNDSVEAAWMNWGLPENCSLDQRFSWIDMQQIGIRTIARDGEVLVRMVDGADNAFGFALQLLDPDLLDEELTTTRPMADGHRIRQGVEEDRNGRVVAYHLWSVHPSEFGTGLKHRDRVPAADIIHLFLPTRIGQQRGTPWAAPVLLDQTMLAAYQEAEVTAARLAASKLYTVSYDAEEGAEPQAAEDGERAVLDEVEPGQGMQLNPGETLTPIEWSHPNTNFDDFSKAILRSVSTGLGVAYSSLTGDLSQVNYSSIRAGLLQERDMWRRLQHWLVMHFHRRVFNRWLKMAALKGHIPAREVNGYTDVDWQPRGWDWVDPLKDIEAASMAVERGFDTRSRICAAGGRDFDDVVARLAEENAILKAAGVTLLTSTGQTDASEAQGAGDAGSADETLPDGAGRASVASIQLARRN